MTDGTSEHQTREKGRSRRGTSALRRGVGVLAFFFLAGVIAVFGGFFWFAGQAANPSLRDTTASADGIVVFTGGKDRIAVAANLLAQGRGRRLLISGVNPSTPRRDLEGLAPEMEQLSDCCIDLGRQAEDTIGNARETADWANGYGFRSLLVVTSAYHLPRSLTELSSAMPDAVLTGVPVVSARLARPWWRDRAALRLLMSEYTKYLASLVRLTFMTGNKPANASG
ncbi:MAG: YdcF family protein [Hyphomicrobiales bacterium]